LALLAPLSASAVAPEPAAGRIALVIGNGAYVASPLVNPARDARAVAERLREAGFRVTLKVDSPRRELQEAIRGFGDALARDNRAVGVFYYAGHGVQLNWRNFMLPVDVRIIAASNRDLAAEVRAGRFREDLYYRLAVVDIGLPPLRDRTEDIPELMRHFMQQFSVQLGVPPLPLSHEVVSRLAGYTWPGNVRELRNYIERSLILGHFPAQPSAAPTAAPTPAGELEASLAEVERRHIERVTAACEGNKTEAARRLGVSRKTLERKFAEWALEDAAAARTERRA